MAPTLESRIQAHSEALRAQPFPGFGHALKPFFGFDPGYVPLNNGSFGACPKHVLNVFNELVVEAERRPDTFMRVEYRPLFRQARAEVAQIVGCHVDDLVLVPNATFGVNAVLRGLNGTWTKGDAILVYETIYGACGKSAQYIVDSNPSFDLKMIKVPLSYPVTHDEVVAKTKAAIRDAGSAGTKIRVCILDAISSLPGVILPWERLCALLRQHDILSLVDAAHAVGQIPLNLAAADPDFFISNCHKWLSAHRGVAFLYTPKRNQRLAHAIPTSWDYESSNVPNRGGPQILPHTSTSNYVSTWEWTGTQDFSNFLSIPAALEFRRWMGGEAAVMSHNATLARRAGEIFTSILGNGSQVMEVANPTEESKLTAAMVNVSIPITARPSEKAEEKGHELAFLAAKIQNRLMEEHDTFIPFYVHAGKIWVRLSAQVWNEEQDYEWAANKIKQLILEEDMQKATI